MSCTSVYLYIIYVFLHELCDLLPGFGDDYSVCFTVSRTSVYLYIMCLYLQELCNVSAGAGDRYSVYVTSV